MDDLMLFSDLKKESGKSDAEVYMVIGVTYVKEKDFKKAEAYFKKAVEVDPRLYLAWFNLGMLNINNENGYDFFKKVAEVKPDFAPTYYFMAYFHYGRDDRKAIPLFKKFIELANNDPKQDYRVKEVKELLWDLETDR